MLHRVAFSSPIHRASRASIHASRPRYFVHQSRGVVRATVESLPDPRTQQYIYDPIKRLFWDRLVEAQYQLRHPSTVNERMEELNQLSPEQLELKFQEVDKAISQLGYRTRFNHVGPRRSPEEIADIQKHILPQLKDEPAMVRKYWERMVADPALSGPFKNDAEAIAHDLREKYGLNEMDPAALDALPKMELPDFDMQEQAPKSIYEEIEKIAKQELAKLKSGETKIDGQKLHY